MKANTHPAYYKSTIICACGNTFTTGSTSEKLHVELCYKCHPFYTGTQKFIDTASLIQKFQKKQEKANIYKVTAIKKKDEEKKRSTAPKSLAEMLSNLK